MTGAIVKNASSGRKINKEIEYLRAVAISMVVVLHFVGYFGLIVGPFRYFHGWTGVDLFLCISGYVISSSFVEFFDDQHAQGRQWRAAFAFWVRRFFRIVPSAWTWLVLVITASIFFNRSGAFGDTEAITRYAAAAVVYIANLVNQNSTLGVYWSLSLEEQFYLLFPLFLLVIAERWRWIVFVALLIFRFFLPGQGVGIFFLTRTDALIWGCLIYLFSRRPAYHDIEPVVFQNRWAALLINGVLLVLISTFPAMPRISMEPFGKLSFVHATFAPYLALACAIPMAILSWLIFHLRKRNMLGHIDPRVQHNRLFAMGLLLLFAAIVPFLVGRFLSVIAIVCAAWVLLASYAHEYVLPLPPACQSILMWIGTRSYALYLVHTPAFYLAAEIWYRLIHADANHGPAPGHTLLYLGTVTPIALALAELNYILIETPFRRRGAMLARRIMLHPVGEAQTAAS